MWEIRENSNRHGKDGRSFDDYADDGRDESYECGYDDGYMAAMKDMSRRRSRREDF